MSYTGENLAEIEVLMLYDLSTSQEGIKIHKTAEHAKIKAARSLYEKGFITQEDGGYLTNLGREASEHAQFLFTMLNAHSGE
ncbi:MAG TPA: TIGR02647 family protein [Gammaproteobacteria bacterium]|nr:TIGR02647 family protein [Gammaproteobacteria bacterium]